MIVNILFIYKDMDKQIFSDFNIGLVLNTSHKLNQMPLCYNLIQVKIIQFRKIVHFLMMSMKILLMTF